MESWGNRTPSSSGPESGEQATHLGPVFAAIRHMVDYGSTLPVDAFRANPDGSRTPTALPALLRSQNELGRYGVGQWIGQCLYGLGTRGNAVGWITEFDGFGFPSVVRWVRGHHWSFNEAAKHWYIDGQPVPSSRVFHVPW